MPLPTGLIPSLYRMRVVISPCSIMSTMGFIAGSNDGSVLVRMRKQVRDVIHMGAATDSLLATCKATYLSRLPSNEACNRQRAEHPMLCLSVLSWTHSS